MVPPQQLSGAAEDGENSALKQWSQYESSRSGGEGALNDSSAATRLYEKQQNDFKPRRTCAHKFFIFYRFLAGHTAFMLAFGQFLGKLEKKTAAEFYYLIMAYIWKAYHVLITLSTRDGH
jgi:hypothetical protein